MLRFFVPSPKFRAALIPLEGENGAQRFWTQDAQMRWSSHQASEDPSVTPNKHANPPQGVAEDAIMRQQDDNRDGGCSVLKLSFPGAPLLKCPTSCSRPEALNLKASTLNSEASGVRNPEPQTPKTLSPTPRLDRPLAVT